jgi:GATA-binding protein, other eukaryote
VKTSSSAAGGQGKKRDSDGLPVSLSHPPAHQQQHQHIPNGTGLPAAHPDVAHAHPHPPTDDALHRVTSAGASISRSNTPSLSFSAHHHNPNIAPQHLFDTVTLPHDTFASPTLPFPAPARHPSPSSLSLNGSSTAHQAGQPQSSHLDAPPPPDGQSYDQLQAQIATFRTRISELEVINDLFRGRVAELEQGEREARSEAARMVEENRRLREEVERSKAAAGHTEGDETRSPKRTKTDDGEAVTGAGQGELEVVADANGDTTMSMENGEGAAASPAVADDPKPGSSNLVSLLA